MFDHTITYNPCASATRDCSTCDIVCTCARIAPEPARLQIGATQRQIVALLRARRGAVNTYDAQCSIASYSAGRVRVVSRALHRLADRGLVLRVERRGDTLDMPARCSEYEYARAVECVQRHPRATTFWIASDALANAYDIE